LRNLFVRHNDPAGSGDPIVYTLRKNGVASALSVSLASTGTQANDITHSVTVAQGDLLDIQVTKANPCLFSPNRVVASLQVSIP
jgi:hypothetical protein